MRRPRDWATAVESGTAAIDPVVARWFGFCSLTTSKLRRLLGVLGLDTIGCMINAWLDTIHIKNNVQNCIRVMLKASSRKENEIQQLSEGIKSMMREISVRKNRTVPETLYKSCDIKWKASRHPTVIFSIEFILSKASTRRRGTYCTPHWDVVSS